MGHTLFGMYSEPPLDRTSGVQVELPQTRRITARFRQPSCIIPPACSRMRYCDVAARPPPKPPREFSRLDSRSHSSLTEAISYQPANNRGILEALRVPVCRVSVDGGEFIGAVVCLTIRVLAAVRSVALHPDVSSQNRLHKHGTDIQQSGLSNLCHRTAHTESAWLPGLSSWLCCWSCWLRMESSC